MADYSDEEQEEEDEEEEDEVELNGYMVDWLPWVVCRRENKSMVSR